MKQILFVDDEPMVLQALQRMLYGMRKEWDMRFASGGAEALAQMAERPAAVVVSDMRMPDMNGAELLNEIMRLYPKTVRFILSGYADMELIMQCVGGTHQFLSKPCDGETLRSVIRRALDMERWIHNDPMQSLVSRLTTVPSLPALYFQILRELRSAETPLENVGATIAQDPAMTAKILQLVNSAFFGLRRQLNSPTEAVIQLGLETIKSLVLGVHVFSELGSTPGTKLDVEKLHHHSLATALSARHLARVARAERKTIEESFTAGLLHDIGQLVLIANLPEEHARAAARSRVEKISLLDAERAEFGVCHAETGGYLLGLWGLPVPIVEAAVFHHSPHECQSPGFTALTAVHAAVTLCADAETEPDREYLTAAGVWADVPGWRRALADQHLSSATA